MAQTIKLKRSAVAGRIPNVSDLELGEIAINTYDGKMYIKKSVNGEESISEIGQDANLGAVFTSYTFTATANQTVFTGNDNSGNALDIVDEFSNVFMNGILLDPEIDFTVSSDGLTLTLTEPAEADDILQINSFDQAIFNGTLNVDALALTGMAGQMVWNSDEETIDVPLNDDVTLQLGQEFVFRGKATEAISNGDVVMFAGAQGGHLLIAKADMSSVGFAPEYVIGIATQDFNTNDFGFVTELGKVRGLDTSGYSEGDILYLDPTTAGALTATKPTPPNHAIQMCAVVNSHITQGTLLVRPTHMVDTDEVAEGSSNLYFTVARAVAAIKADGDWNASNWDTAYGWGNHASAGYLTAADVPSYNRVKVLATANQTVVSVAGGYTPSQVEVYYNGVLLDETDYAATNGTNIVFPSNFLRENDEVTVVSAVNVVSSEPGMSNFVVESGGVEKIVSDGKHLNVQGGNNISVSFTTDGIGTQNDPYDLTISHADTSSQSSVNYLFGNVVTEIGVDGNGHITYIGSSNLDNRYIQDSSVESARLSTLNLHSGLFVDEGSFYVRGTFNNFVGNELTSGEATGGTAPTEGQVLSYSGGSLTWANASTGGSSESSDPGQAFISTFTTSSVSSNDIIPSPSGSPGSNSLVVVGGYPYFDPNMSYCCWYDDYNGNAATVAVNNYSSYSSSSSVSSQGGMNLSYNSGPGSSGFIAFVDSTGWDTVYDKQITGSSGSGAYSLPYENSFPNQEGEVYLMIRSNINFGDGSNLLLATGVTLDYIEYFSETGINFLKLTISDSATKNYAYIDWGSYSYSPYSVVYIIKGGF